MCTSKITREVLKKRPETSYDEVLLLLLVWQKQGLTLPKQALALIQDQKLALPSTILRAKARIEKRSKRGEKS